MSSRWGYSFLHGELREIRKYDKVAWFYLGRSVRYDQNCIESHQVRTGSVTLRTLQFVSSEVLGNGIWKPRGRGYNHRNHCQASPNRWVAPVVLVWRRHSSDSSDVHCQVLNTFSERESYLWSHLSERTESFREAKVFVILDANSVLGLSEIKQADCGMKAFIHY